MRERREEKRGEREKRREGGDGERKKRPPSQGSPLNLNNNNNNNNNNNKNFQLQAEYNRAAIQVAFLAGILYTAVGVFRLSFFINFLSHSVIAGFMTGAAVTIMTSQFRNA